MTSSFESLRTSFISSFVSIESTFLSSELSITNSFDFSIGSDSQLSTKLLSTLSSQTIVVLFNVLSFINCSLLRSDSFSFESFFVTSLLLSQNSSIGLSIVWFEDSISWLSTLSSITLSSITLSSITLSSITLSSIELVSFWLTSSSSALSYSDSPAFEAEVQRFSLSLSY